MSKVLVTGGGGFIGSNLVRYLVTRDDHLEVVVLDDFSTGRAANLDGIDVHVIEGSILDLEVLDEAVQGVTSIVHLAAIPSVPRSIVDPRRSHDANATGTLNVLEAARARGVEHVVVASSSSVYGNNPEMPKREDAWTRPMSPYAATKLLTEAYALAYGFSFGMKTLALRFFNVYGPGQLAGHAYAAVIPQFIDQALRGLPLSINGDGEQSRDFTFVDSVCAAIHSACVAQTSSDSPVNLAFGTNTTLNELVALLSDIVGEPLPVVYGPIRPGDVRASQADSTRLSTLFPDVSPYPIRDGLSRTVEWHRDRLDSVG